MSENNQRRKISRPGLISQQLNEMGKMPPQAVELEEAILCSILIEPDSIIRIIDFIQAETFYKESHQIIFRAAMQLFDKSYPIDMLTVIEHLKLSATLEQAGGHFYISQMTNKISSGANLESHARIIQQKYVMRESIRECSDIIQQCYQETTDIFDLLDKRQTSMNTLISGIMKKTEQGSKQMFSEFLKHLELVAKNESTITGCPSTLKDVDRVLRGYQKTDLIIIAGRPGMGKSSAVKSIINGCIGELKKVALYFSLEMSTPQNVARLLSEDVEVPANHFNSNEFLQKTDFTKLQHATGKYFDKAGNDLLIIDDTPSFKINEIRAKAKLIASKVDVGVILVDYLQLIDGPGENTTNQVDNVSKGLKALAKELKLPVIALAQLNRNVENRTGSGTGTGSSSVGKRPQLSDLRSSGGIEQSADVVIFLHRPEYYDIMQDGEGNSMEGVCYYIIAKNRNGGTDEVKVRFKKELTKFEDWNNYVPTSPSPSYNPMAGLEPNADFSTPPASRKIDNHFEEDPF